MSWHADPADLDRYARGRLDAATAFSLEAHLLACVRCRGEVATVVPPERLQSTWTGLEAVLDAPRAGPLERLLIRLGLADHHARLLAATPALRLSWLAAVAVTLSFGVVAAHLGDGERSLLAFLVVAPLLPVAGVAAAFAPGLDPTYEVGVAAPIPAFRLLLTRAAAVLVTTVVLAGLAAAALPWAGALVAAWLLPALGLTLASLAVSTFVAPAHAATALGLMWVGGVAVSEVVAAGSLAALRMPGPIQSAAFSAGGQVSFLVLGILAVLVLLQRRDAFEMRREA